MLIMTAQHGRTLQIAKERADDWKNKRLMRMLYDWYWDPGELN